MADEPRFYWCAAELKRGLVEQINVQEEVSM
jgi:hypothetical protein